MEKQEEVTLTKIIIQEGQAFKLPDSSTVGTEGLLIWMANELIKIRKAIG